MRNDTFLVWSQKCETQDPVIGITFIVFLNYQMATNFEINAALRVSMYK